MHTELENYMTIALKLAVTAYEIEEVPVGAIVISAEGTVLGKGYNQVEMLKDATAHAEMLAITSAMGTIENKYLNGCTLIVTLEPCPMCAGAILNSKINRLIFGAYDHRLGAFGTRTSFSQLYGNSLEIIGGIKEEESSFLLKKFFSKRRN